MIPPLRNVLRPAYLPEIARKVYTRTRYGLREQESARTWALEHSQSMGSWAECLDADLWQEALRWASDFEKSAQPKVAELRSKGITLGGGGSYELLYFLTRLRRPQLILETGVAAGWSTAAFLAAIQHNGTGRLISSDFPYFRLPDPERYIGVLVPEELKENWTLHVRGDRKNLAMILTPGLEFDLVHYDSDKSRPGREWFSRRIRPHLASGAIVLWDDIVDNLHFRDRETSGSWAVFEHKGRTVGLVGDPCDETRT